MIANDTTRTKCPDCIAGVERSLGGIKYMCKTCNGKLFVFPKKEASQSKASHDVKIDKRSKVYKEAHKQLMDLGLSAKEAHNKFKDEENARRTSE